MAHLSLDHGFGQQLQTKVKEQHFNDECGFCIPRELAEGNATVAAAIPSHGPVLYRKVKHCTSGAEV